MEESENINKDTLNLMAIKTKYLVPMIANRQVEGVLQINCLQKNYYMLRWTLLDY
jgi:hypothetical protein